MQPILELRDIKTHFPVRGARLWSREKQLVHAVDGVSLSLKQGEVLGLVGESGSGKSTLARTIMQLTPASSGEIYLNGIPIPDHPIREIQMIFQDPYASLNPRHTVYDTLAEPLRVHKLYPAKEIPSRIAELMTTVGLSPQFMKKYPHEFSGGQRQRIAIARAIALQPKIIIADEPVSALDVSIQAQILNLLAELTRKNSLTLIFVSHDLSVVKHISDRIAVMYLGKIVELGDARQVIEDPRHPYTRALISAVPTTPHQKKSLRITLSGDPPSPINPPSGCSFHTRCPYAVDACSQKLPPLRSYGDQREVACIRVDEIP